MTPPHPCAPRNRFERHPLATVVLLWVCLAVTSLLALNIVLERGLGLGEPILYRTHPLYGYRLLPDQRTRRFRGASIQTNNLGLRADRDWDANEAQKVLFVGDSVTYGGSYISNEELFSSLAVEGIDGVVSGNAAVNGWGIDNMFHLIVSCHFNPAQYYVVVLGEIDFYRRLTQIKGLPFWCQRPRSGLEEIANHMSLSFARRRYLDWIEFASPEEVEAVIEGAACLLGSMAEYLTSRGYVHAIYVTPTLRQLTGAEPIDKLVRGSMKRHGLSVCYLADRIVPMGIERKDINSLFVDHVHLSIAGHRLWAEIIGKDLREMIRSSSAPEDGRHAGCSSTLSPAPGRRGWVRSASRGWMSM